MQQPASPEEILRQLEAVPVRSVLRSIVDAYEMLLEEGRPPRGRTVHAREQFDQWEEDSAARVLRGRQVLAQLETLLPPS